ncbi:hypothetical protein [Salisediminibacterium halotolerans]|uniref:DUF4083 domain-containing protein n=1 Tax=Salisediminibacterium halotolerans TaxID=517425 RepID=A0A1H9T0G3_9BACI|nr:hypothetical protein [Salisediminibacterium haloalkalitolerans]SER90638.1 hypothetical protein SAMN05444126_10888 [Salisediminibacterium haloalkalitolerans]
MFAGIMITNALFQLFSFAIIIGAIFFIVSIVRSSKQRNEQLKTIAEKMDHLEKKVDKISSKDER